MKNLTYSTKMQPILSAADCHDKIHIYLIDNHCQLCYIRCEDKREGMAVIMIKSDKSEFSFQKVGHFITDKEWIHPDIIQTTHQLIFVVAGEVHMCENGKNYSLKRGDTLFLEANKRHYGFERSTGFTSFYWLHFFLNDFSCFPNFPVTMNNFDNFQLIKELLHYSAMPDTHTFQLDILCANIIIQLCNANIRKGDVPKLANDIFAWIRINANANLSVTDVSDFFRFTPEYISRITQKYFNAPLKALINNFIVSQAKNLLLNSNYSVKEISSILEFSSSNSFTKFFKYHVHKTPMEYKNFYSRTHLNNNNENKANGILLREFTED